MARTLLRGTVVSFDGPPGADPAAGLTHHDDGVVELDGARIGAVQGADAFAAAGGNLAHCEDLRPALILPGFIDAHVHHAQLDAVAGYGTQLLDWLERYAFPAEIAFASAEHQAAQAECFLDLLAAHGTTTSLTFTTVHAGATDALFRAAHRRGVRLIAGKVLMDRNAPAALLDGDTGFAASAALIERWHGVGRLAYAVTPRFAITSSPAQLEAAGKLLERYPGTYLHTHLAENRDEIAATLRAHPEAADYTGVYERYGLVTDRSVFAHGIHLADDELDRLAATGAAIAFCPSSNLFLGSGLLDLERVRRHRVRLAVGTDVGAGTSLLLPATLGDGYRVAQLRAQSWDPLAAFHAATRGNAAALGLDDRVGRLAPGYEADLVVLGARGQALLERRLAAAASLAERLFAYMMLGDERVIERTYVGGRLAHARPAR